MKEVHVRAEASVCDAIGTLLEGFWEHQTFRNGHPGPAYRAMTGFLLGIQLRDRFGDRAVENSSLGNLPMTHSSMEIEMLEDWVFKSHVCYGQVGYHAMEALFRVFRYIYQIIEEDQELRSLDGRIFTLDEWAASGVFLANQVENFGRLAALRNACLMEAKTCQDWLTLGLCTVDNWWVDETSSGPPEKTDVMAIVLAAPYGATPLERFGMAHLITDIKLKGLTDAWGGDLDGAVAMAFATARNIYKQHREYFNLLIKEASNDFHLTGHNSLEEILQLYLQFIPSRDPAVWEPAISGAARNYTCKAVRIPYLPIFLAAPSIMRCAIDFGFWGGLIASALEEGLL